jgi:hypothetical protein
MAIEKVGDLKMGLNRATFVSSSAASSSSSSSSSSGTAKAEPLNAIQPAAVITAAPSTSAPSRPEPVLLDINLSQLPAIQETAEIVPIRIRPDEKLSKLMAQLAVITGYERKDLKLKIGRRVANNDHLTIQDSGLIISNSNYKTRIYLVIA